MMTPCPKCNQPNLPEAAFCHNCSSPLRPAPPIGAPAAQQQWAPPGGPVGQPASASAAGPSSRAIIALVLAILSLICCGPFSGIPAAIVGWMELGAINQGQSPPAGKWMAQVGLWGGIACTVLHIIIYVIYLLFAVLAASSPQYY
ncbi:MAG: zinc ribbon domain-containing protein [Acidobacteriota bacterium]